MLTWLFLRLTTPFLSMSVFRFLPDFRMSSSQEQRIRITNLGLDDAQITGSVEQAGIPAFPVRQKLLNPLTKIHRLNVYEAVSRDNDTSAGNRFKIVIGRLPILPTFD